VHKYITEETGFVFCVWVYWVEFDRRGLLQAWNENAYAAEIRRMKKTLYCLEEQEQLRQTNRGSICGRSWYSDVLHHCNAITVIRVRTATPELCWTITVALSDYLRTGWNNEFSLISVRRRKVPSASGLRNLDFEQRSYSQLQLLLIICCCQWIFCAYHKNKRCFIIVLFSWDFEDQTILSPCTRVSQKAKGFF